MNPPALVVGRMSTYPKNNKENYEGRYWKDIVSISKETALAELLDQEAGDDPFVQYAICKVQESIRATNTQPNRICLSIDDDSKNGLRLVAEQLSGR